MTEVDASMDDLNITPERKKEIDEILMETHEKYINGEVKAIPLKEFLEENSKMYNLCEEKVMNKEMFKNVFVFAFSEPGAMGAGGYIDCITDKGERFSICYLSDETPWEDVKSCFPMLRDCCFNGPMKNRPNSTPEIVIYMDDKNKDKETRVAPGWKHIYMGFGNHLVIREDHFTAYFEYLKDLTEEVDIYSEWDNRAMKYIEEQQE